MRLITEYLRATNKIAVVDAKAPHCLEHRSDLKQQQPNDINLLNAKVLQVCLVARAEGFTRPRTMLTFRKLTYLFVLPLTTYPASKGLSFAWLLAFTTSFARLVCSVVGLFTPGVFTTL